MELLDRARRDRNEDERRGEGRREGGGLTEGGEIRDLATRNEEPAVSMQECVAWSPSAQLTD